MPTRVFVLGMVHEDGTLDAAELYDAGAAAGLTVHQIRLCLARLVKEGMLEQHGRGRRAELALTAHGRRAVEPEPEFLRLAFRQDAGLEPWDGMWHLVTFSIPEDRRTARNELRELLASYGAPLGAGVYACANDWEDLVTRVARDLDVTEHVVLAAAARLRVGGESDPRRIAGQLWDLDGLADRWTTFSRAHRPIVQRLARAVDGATESQVPAILATTIRLTAAFDAVMHTDPLLPPELLQTSWPGAEGRQLLLRAARTIDTLRLRHEIPALFRHYHGVIDDAIALEARKR
jgi:phenylacetic acid degradation operon negative regulatory protein